MPRFSSLLSLFFLACVGCASPLAGAVHELEAGQLPEANQRFRALEPDFADFSQDDRARYALYRGLTHLALGDAREAQRWLGAVQRAAKQSPGLLEPADRGRLLAAWRSLGHMPGE